MTQTHVGIGDIVHYSGKAVLTGTSGDIWVTRRETKRPFIVAGERDDGLGEGNPPTFHCIALHKHEEEWSRDEFFADSHHLAVLHKATYDPPLVTQTQEDS